jgi:hypothetical protein
MAGIQFPAGAQSPDRVWWSNELKILFKTYWLIMQEIRRRRGGGGGSSSSNSSSTFAYRYFSI